MVLWKIADIEILDFDNQIYIQHKLFLQSNLSDNINLYVHVNVVG